MKSYTSRNEAFFDLIPKAASFACSDFPDVSQEDIEQDLWILVLENDKIDPTRDGVMTILIRMAKARAWEYRKEQLVWTTQYSYRTSDLRLILMNIYSPEDWDTSPIPTDARSMDGNKYDVFADVSWGITKLPAQYQRAIERRFRDLVDPAVGSAERTRLNRAIKRLAEVLNYYRRPLGTWGGPGSRKALNNQQSRFVIQEQDGSND